MIIELLLELQAHTVKNTSFEQVMTLLYSLLKPKKKNNYNLLTYCCYSRLPIIRTFKGNRKKFELSAESWGVRVIESKIIWKII